MGVSNWEQQFHWWSLQFWMCNDCWWNCGQCNFITLTSDCHLQPPMFSPCSEYWPVACIAWVIVRLGFETLMEASSQTYLGVGHFVGIVVRDYGFDPQSTFFVIFSDRLIGVVSFIQLLGWWNLTVTNVVNCFFHLQQLFCGHSLLFTMHISASVRSCRNYCTWLKWKFYALSDKCIELRHVWIFKF